MLKIKVVYFNMFVYKQIPTIAYLIYFRKLFCKMSYRVWFYEHFKKSFANQYRFV